MSLLLYFRPKHAANHEDPQVAMINGQPHGYVRAFSLVSDMNYVTQNAARIARALFADVRENAQVHQGYRDWLGIRDVGLYNFRPSVRPVLLVVRISSYPGKHYCPRIATINKPAFQGIKQHSTAEPRQSRSRTSS